jgi:hypothetical protein
MATSNPISLQPPPWKATTRIAQPAPAPTPTPETTSPFEPQPTPDEIDKPMSRTTKAVLIGAAVLGVALLLKGKKR